MWCSKCHCGNASVNWKLNNDGKMSCSQCGNCSEPLTKSPFLRENSNRSNGRRNDNDVKPVPKKFQFDQKGGSDSYSPSIQEVKKEDA